MKKLFLAFMLMLPLMAAAKGPVDAKYLKGAVPEENGVIVFRKSFSVPGMPKDQIFSTLGAYISKAVIGPAIHEHRTRIMNDGKTDGNIVAKVEEYMVFKNRFLNLDRTRFIYQIQASVEGEKVKLAISQISYYYNEDQEGKNGVTYKGEEWITDAEALNKRGDKIYPSCAKFRIKTIDRVEQIFEDCMDAFEIAATEPAKEAPVKKVRKGIVED
jgi:colicin import membrane protein